jgi:hypothetical protein
MFALAIGTKFERFAFHLPCHQTEMKATGRTIILSRWSGLGLIENVPRIKLE